MERTGFIVHAHTDYYEMEAAHADPLNRMRIIETGPVEQFKDQYDLVLMVINMKGYAQENNVRVK